MWKYIKNILIALDQLINTLIKGEPDETLSSRAWRHYADGSYKWPKRIIDTLLFFDKDHCYTSWLSEKNRKHFPHSFRKLNN